MPAIIGDLTLSAVSKSSFAQEAMNMRAKTRHNRAPRKLGQRTQMRTRRASSLSSPGRRQVPVPPGRSPCRYMETSRYGKKSQSHPRLVGTAIRPLPSRCPFASFRFSKSAFIGGFNSPNSLLLFLVSLRVFEPSWFFPPKIRVHRRFGYS